MSKGKIVPNECAAEGVETHTHGPPMGCQWPGRFPPGFWGSCCLLRNVLVPIPVTSTVAAVEVRDSSGQGLAGVLREQFPRAPGCSRNLHSLPELFRLRNPPQAETACRRAEAASERVGTFLKFFFFHREVNFQQNIYSDILDTIK